MSATDKSGTAVPPHKPESDTEEERAKARKTPLSSGSVTDDTAGGNDMMAPGKSTAGLPEFRR